MCDDQKSFNMKQYHPVLQEAWNRQLTAYVPLVQQVIINEEFIDWDDPYRNIRFWTIVDFLRGFKLTK
jgi:hypothetical protein